MSGNGGPPPYTLCDPFDEQSFLPRNIAVSLCCLAVNISFLVYYYRLHQMPESFHGLHSLEEESTNDLDEEEGAALRPRRKKQGVFSLNWGFGGKWYLYRESLNGFFITFPTILWFFVFHLTGNREYACAWQYGLYGFPLLFLQSALVPLLVYWMGTAGRTKYHQAFDLMDIKPTDHVLLMPGYRGSYLVELCKRVPQGRVCAIDAYDTRWQPESRLWIEGNMRAAGLHGVDVQSVNGWDRLPYEEGQFDVIVSCFMSHMMWLNQPHDTITSKRRRTQQLMVEMRRVLRPGGTVQIIEMVHKAKRAKANLLGAGFHSATVRPKLLWFGLIPEKLVSGRLFPPQRSKDHAGVPTARNSGYSRQSSGRKLHSKVPNSSRMLTRASLSMRSQSAPVVPDPSRDPDMVLPWATGNAWDTHLGLRLGLLSVVLLAYVFGVVSLGHNWGNSTLAYLPYLPFFNQAGQAVLIGLWPVPVLCFWIHETMSQATHYAELPAKDVVWIFAKELAWLPPKLAFWICFVFWPSWLIDYNLGQTLTVAEVYVVQSVVNFSLWMVMLAVIYMLINPMVARWEDAQANSPRSGETQRLLGVLAMKEGPHTAVTTHVQIQRQRSRSLTPMKRTANAYQTT